MAVQNVSLPSRASPTLPGSPLLSSSSSLPLPQTTMNKTEATKRKRNQRLPPLLRSTQFMTLLGGGGSHGGNGNSRRQKNPWRIRRHLTLCLSIMVVLVGMLQMVVVLHFQSQTTWMMMMTSHTDTHPRDDPRRYYDDRHFHPNHSGPQSHRLQNKVDSNEKNNNNNNKLGVHYRSGVGVAHYRPAGTGTGRRPNVLPRLSFSSSSKSSTTTGDFNETSTVDPTVLKRELTRWFHRLASRPILIVGGSDGSGTRGMVDVLKRQLLVDMVVEDAGTLDVHGTQMLDGQGWPALVRLVLSNMAPLSAGGASSSATAANYDPLVDLPLHVQTTANRELSKLLVYLRNAYTNMKEKELNRLYTLKAIQLQQTAAGAAGAPARQQQQQQDNVPTPTLTTTKVGKSTTSGNVTTKSTTTDTTNSSHNGLFYPKIQIPTVANKVVFGFKAPVTMLLLPVLSVAIGRSFKFIHVMRDGRDVALSDNQSPVDKFYNVTYPDYEHRLQHFSGDLERVRAMQLWNDWNSQAYQWAKAHPSKVDYMMIRTEDLVRIGPKRLEVLQTLSDFVGSPVPFHDLCCYSVEKPRDHGKSVSRSGPQQFKLTQQGQGWDPANEPDEAFARRYEQNLQTRPQRQMLYQKLDNHQPQPPQQQDHGRRRLSLLAGHFSTSSPSYSPSQLVKAFADRLHQWALIAKMGSQMNHTGVIALGNRLIPMYNHIQEHHFKLLQQQAAVVDVEEAEMFLDFWKNHQNEEISKKHQRFMMEKDVSKRYGKWQSIVNTTLLDHFYREGALGLKLFGYHPWSEMEYSRSYGYLLTNATNAVTTQGNNNNNETTLTCTNETLSTCAATTLMLSPAL